MVNLLSRKIFIVDDDELILKSIHRQLSNIGFTDINRFENGYDCIDSLEQEPYLVLLDYQMEDLNGYDVLRKIKRYNPNTHVIMLSSQRDVSSAIETLKFGAFDYITKGTDDLIKLEEALNRLQKLEDLTLIPRRPLLSKLLRLS